MDKQQAIDRAYEFGNKAGQARKEHDEARASSWREYFVRFRNTVPSGLGLQAGELELHYGEGYRDANRRSPADVRAMNYGA